MWSLLVKDLLHIASWETSQSQKKQDSCHAIWEYRDSCSDLHKQEDKGSLGHRGLKAGGGEALRFLYL